MIDSPENTAGPQQPDPTVIPAVESNTAPVAVPAGEVPVATVETVPTQRVSPWRHIGQSAKGAVTAEEAMTRLNWKVGKFPLQIAKEGPVVHVRDSICIAKVDDTGYPTDVLGTVGSKYEIIQNSDAFSFGDNIFDRDLQIESVGEMRGGKKIWLLARLPRDIKIAGSDVIYPYVLFTTAHDGSGAAQVMACPERFTCSNTLNVAIFNSVNKISVRHTKNATGKLEQAREVLVAMIGDYRKFEETANFLVSIQVNGQMLMTFLNKAVPFKKNASEVSNKRVETIRSEVTSLFENGRGNNENGTKRTLWTAFNAVAEYADHYKTVRKETPERRLESIWFGNSISLKDAAWTTAIEMAGTA